jgi:hypothetical protein
MQNVEQTIISQYGTSPVLNQLIQNMNAYIDPSADIQSFYDSIWNISTASGYGLDVWGKIVGVGRLFEIPNTGPWLGFQDGSTDSQPFGQSPFYAGPSTGSYLLSDNAFRTLILVKAIANISNCSIQSYNTLLSNLFRGRGRCYASDLGNMQMLYTFEFVLEPFELAILQQSNALPRPAGVSASIVQVIPSNYFGFNGSGLQPFGQGIFYTKNIPTQ